LPLALEGRIAAVDGVKAVAYANWFGGAYQEPRNQVFSFAVSPNYIDLYPEIELGADARNAFAQTRTGVIVGDKLATQYGWKVGDKLPLISNIFPNTDGSKNWTFDIVGIMKPKDPSHPEFFQGGIFLNWKYFDDSTPYNRGRVGWYVTRVADVGQADRVARAIDALSANSDHETKTQTEQAATASWIKQMADIGLIVGSIMGAVFFTLILLSGNTMMRAVSERTAELAVLKTIGFSNRSVLAMVLAESVLLLVLGGLVGLALASAVIPAVTAGSGGVLNLPPIDWHSWALGVVLMVVIGLVVGALPAASAMRLNIVDALAGR
jgi:putative ABC transport system permease protein